MNVLRVIGFILVGILIVSLKSVRFTLKVAFSLAKLAIITTLGLFVLASKATM